MFEHNLHPILFSVITDKILVTLRASFILLSSNDASADISDDEGSFDFSLKTEFTSHLYVHVTLVTDTEAATSCFAQLLQYSQNIFKLLASKCFLNDVLLEREYSEIMLILWFVSIKYHYIFFK